MNIIQPPISTKRTAQIAAKGASTRRNRSGRITQIKILDAAEQIFAEKGIHGASLREIMIEAEVNIAAVNYYFGNKSDLLRAVVQRRSSVINSARMTLLDTAYAPDRSAISLDGWLKAFITPFADAENNPDPGWRNFMRVLNWVATTQAQDKLCQEIVQETYGAMRKNFVEALAQALPNLSAEDIAWRYQCAIAVMRACVITRDRVASSSMGAIDSVDVPRMLAHIMPFLRGGFTAPASGFAS